MARLELRHCTQEGDVLPLVCMGRCMGRCNSALSSLSSLTDSTAAANSILGIVICFRGATLAFPIMKQICSSPWSS